jgi:hypothetical protein
MLRDGRRLLHEGFVIVFNVFISFRHSHKAVAESDYLFRHIKESVRPSRIE